MYYYACTYVYMYNGISAIVPFYVIYMYTAQQ